MALIINPCTLFSCETLCPANINHKIVWRFRRISYRCLIFSLTQYMNSSGYPQRMIFKSLYLWNPTFRPLVFQTVNSFKSNNLRLKFKRFPPAGFKDIRTKTLYVCDKDSILLSNYLDFVKPLNSLKY